MASTRKSNLLESVAARLAPHLPPHSSILIGLSGGMDSVVLLHVLHTLAPRFQWQLCALHVNHGISPHADAWANFCAAFCQSYSIPLQTKHVDIKPLRGEQGLEAAARKLRYAAFAAQACDFVALAHHADDQAETVLLQLLRGAGVKGAAAMPLRNTKILRPLLDSTRAELNLYAEQHALTWMDDESNTDISYPRNYLRHQVMPVLEARFPHYRKSLARSAQHFAESEQLLQELARQDGGAALTEGVLEVSCLCSLLAARAKNLLRYFLHLQGAPMPQVAQIEDMLRQLCDARLDAQLLVSYAGWQLRRFQGRVYVSQALSDFDAGMNIAWDGTSALDWSPLANHVSIRQAQGQGISMDMIKRGALSFRLRTGGESLRPHPNACKRSLKHLFQELSIPPWQRARLPLLYCGEDLVCVVGVAIHADYQAKKDEVGVVVSLK